MASSGKRQPTEDEVEHLQMIWSKFGMHDVYKDDVTRDDPIIDENKTLKLLIKYGIGCFSNIQPNVSLNIKRRAELNAWRKALPIYKFKEAFIKMVKENQVTVVVGATGSGKSTQITQYLIEAGIAKTRVGCTQPRRVAASSLAKRVAEEFGTTVGDKVGYKIRFENCAGSDTIIKYMTDGVLVTEFCIDQTIEDYSVLVLDEAHERSVHTDVVLGLLKLCLTRRPDLKVIVTSATLDSDKFSGYFGGTPILNIPGRGFPVNIEYAYNDPDFLTSSVDKVMWIHENEPTGDGDILVFLPGQEEIEIAWDKLLLRMDELTARRPSIPEMLILPFYSSLPPESLNEIGEPAPIRTRKVILATNIAETSLTIDNINYVVDPGLAKQREYNPRSGVESLIIKQITKAQAIQRAGRTGRTAPGTVYRLYSRYTFDTMMETPIPEIQRCNVESVVLQLASIGITDIVSFPFIDPPQTESVLAAMEYLLELGALITVERIRIEMTQIGRKMAGFPLEPTLAKVLIKSAELGCSYEILSIVSILSTQNPNVFTRPKKRRAEADLKSARFRHELGDHMTLLNVYQDWHINRCREKWCRENFINSRVLEEAEDIRKQLALLMQSQNLPILSCGSSLTNIQHALCSGFFHKIARRTSKGHNYSIYAAGSLEDAFIFPSSALFKAAPSWVLYHEIVKTKKPYMRNVIKIEPGWIKIHSPTFFAKLTKVFPDLLYVS